jgi:hypothetical protein
MPVATSTLPHVVAWSWYRIYTILMRDVGLAPLDVFWWIQSVDGGLRRDTHRDSWQNWERWMSRQQQLRQTATEDGAPPEDLQGYIMHAPLKNCAHDD